MASRNKDALQTQKANCQGNGSAGAADHLGYQVKRIGRYHTTAEMDSLRIKDRRTWFRYSQNTGGDAITLVQQFCDKTFPEAVEYLLTFNGRARDSPAKAVPSVKRDEVQKPILPCHPGIRMTAESLPTCANAASPRR